jgi:hypothetical protein
MGSVNLRVLRKEIIVQAQKPVEQRANKVLENALNRQRDRFIQEFDAHEVTQAIQSGPNDNDGIVNTKKGGNLYSLIGFNSGESPTATLRKFLYDSFKLRDGLRLKANGNKIIAEKTAELPTMVGAEVETAGKHGVGQWTNKSWVKLIEDGIPWFRAYLFNKGGMKNSRSGNAIEAKDKEGNLKTIRNESFGPISYLSGLLKRLRDRVSK